MPRELLADIDLASPVDSLVRWITSTLDPVFDLVSDATSFFVTALTDVLTGPPAAALIALFTLLALTIRGWSLAVFTALAFLLVDQMGFWSETMQTLALVLIAAGVAIALGVPFGLLAARSRAVSATMRPILDFMQTMPAFIYLLVAVIFFRVGVVPGVVASVIFALPPAVRLTELGIRQVDREVVEAADAFGSRTGQTLRQVQIPLAMPTIMAGVNQVIMLSLSMVVIAGLGGAPGLGALVVRSVTRLEIGLGFESGLCVVILAIFLDRVTEAFRDRVSIEQRTTGRFFASLRRKDQRESPGELEDEVAEQIA
jgi:glycine betaine/proline transport system permease protein